MTETESKINKKSNNEILNLIENKLEFYKNIIQKTIINIQKNKINDILGTNEVSTCIDKISDISKKIQFIESIKNKNSAENIIQLLQAINNDISSLIKIYGTDSIEDLLIICFGNNYKNIQIDINDNFIQKFDIIKKYFHPTSYKITSKKADKKNNKGNEEILNENIQQLDCLDILFQTDKFYLKVYEIKIYIHHKNLDKGLMIYGVLDNILIEYLNNIYLNNKIKDIIDNKPNTDEFNNENFNKYIDSLNLKDLLILNNNQEYYEKYIGQLNQFHLLKLKPINTVIKEFIASELYDKRTILIQILIKSNNYENQYLAYMLYDLLSNENNGNIDTQEQMILFDSLPWTIKNYFKQAMKSTIQYSTNLSNFDLNKIPLEQQICLLKVTDTVKEKAMMKLKELKSKSDDSGSKARQYLDGLLKIPFGTYKKEPVLNIMSEIRNKFKDIHFNYKIDEINININENENDIIIPKKENYTSIEVLKYINQIKNYINSLNNQNKENYINNLKKILTSGDKKKLYNNLHILNELISNHVNIIYHTIESINKYNKDQLKEEINKILLLYLNDNNILNSAINKLNLSEILQQNKNKNNEHNLLKLNDDLLVLENKQLIIKNYMKDVKNILDQSVYGHDKAKKQIERIICQWINGELSGYCFGFEGPPGLGKTTLAKKGLADCLKDDEGKSRPFAMIQMGGDSNGSTLHGHNYTYVGSTWGSIVQILMDKKCMNPIIFIDEVDKISKTEHGKEIIGILTHLLDPAQNDCFQDKYFNGIDLDLSKALFILSYNDVDVIDKILLDRVHRIKFNSLSLEDKIIICNNHILPEVYKKMGLENMIILSNDTLKFIIDEYTNESGVRKLKEIIFEIIGEINLDIIKNNNIDYDIPINISINDIKSKYFKDKHEIKHKLIHNESKIGVINGLWANSLGKGGVIPIQTNWRPCNKFLDLFLTGTQGDVMKESMNVALTLAWNLSSDTIKHKIRIEYGEDININGVHIHCPDTSTPKDGPSAGTAITVLIYSLFNDKKIKYNFAITGEICLDGNVTEIGGLDLKFLGGIKAGVKNFIFPQENIKDYNNFIEKYTNNHIIKDINFFPVKTIFEVFKLIYEND